MFIDAFPSAGIGSGISICERANPEVFVVTPATVHREPLKLGISKSTA